MADSTPGPYKAAAIQISVGTDREENLARCLDRLDEATRNGAELVVFPELCNIDPHAIPAGDDIAERAYAEAADLSGPFVTRIREVCRSEDVTVAVNLAMRGDEPNVYIATLLAAPSGILASYEKTILFGDHQHNWACPGRMAPPVIETEGLGRIGLYTCMDGLIPETTRVLAVHGAQVLLNPLQSAGPDETFLHIPERAVENRVWVVSANKVGELTEGHAKEFIGGSQIIAPDGTIEARASEDTEEIVYATVDPATADDKHVPGVGDILADRRPETYLLHAAPDDALPVNASGRAEASPLDVPMASVQVSRSDDAGGTLERAVAAASDAIEEGAEILVLPELFLERTGQDGTWRLGDHNATEEALADLGSLCATESVYCVVNAVEHDGGDRYCTASLIGPSGDVVGTYRKTHLAVHEREQFVAGDDYPVFPTEFGDVGIMIGSETYFPEVARELALSGADVILHPTAWRSDPEVDLLLVERAAENHLSILSANRQDSPARRGSRIVQAVEFPTSPHWKVRSPVPTSIPWGVEGTLVAPVCPGHSRDKTVAPRTNLVENRRSEFYGPLTEPVRGSLPGSTDFEPVETMYSD